jgi:hypothetical protein
MNKLKKAIAKFFLEQNGCSTIVFSILAILALIVAIVHKAPHIGLKAALIALALTTLQVLGLVICGMVIGVVLIVLICCAHYYIDKKLEEWKNLP